MPDITWTQNSQPLLSSPPSWWRFVSPNESPHLTYIRYAYVVRFVRLALASIMLHCVSRIFGSAEHVFFILPSYFPWISLLISRLKSLFYIYRRKGNMSSSYKYQKPGSGKTNGTSKRWPLLWQCCPEMSNYCTRSVLSMKTTCRLSFQRLFMFLALSLSLPLSPLSLPLSLSFSPSTCATSGLYLIKLDCFCSRVGRVCKSDEGGSYKFKAGFRCGSPI